MAEESTEAPAKAKKGGKGKLIVGLVAVVALAAGAYVFLGKGNDSGAAVKLPPCPETPALGPTSSTTAPVACRPKPEPAKGGVLQMDPVTVSLADGSLVKVAIGVQLGTGDVTKMTEEHAGAAALDATVTVLSQKTAEGLAPGEARDKAKEEVSERAVASYEPGEVLGVYFTEFVLQAR